MRRKPGTLLPIEVSILASAIGLREGGESEFHGYRIASEMREREGARRLTAHGTLYKALDRLEEGGLLRSRWEDPEIAAEEHRPLRRLYEVTALGERALRAAESPSPAASRPGLAPS
jgi:PadR family transcriptional regulator PadR